MPERRPSETGTCDVGRSVGGVVSALGGLRMLSDSELHAALTHCGRIRSWVSAAEARLLGEVTRRRGDATSALKNSQGGSSRQAKRSATRSSMLSDLPDVADALAQGSITEEHADLFARVAKEHQKELASEAVDLLGQASTEDADRFRQQLLSWQREQDRRKGTSESDRQRMRRNGSISVRPEDGMNVFHFELDPLAGARARKALSQEAQKMWTEDNKARGGDRRTATQRRADAFERLVTRGAGPVLGQGNRTGVGTTILVVADLDTLINGLPGRCHLADGTPLPVDKVRELAVDAELIPAIFDGKGQPLWAGRSRRLPSRIQRAVIEARDQGCRVPGCDCPPEWTQIHHIIWWRNGGHTDVDQLIMVCSKHHHMIHDDGWDLQLNGDGTVSWRGPP